MANGILKRLGGMFTTEQTDTPPLPANGNSELANQPKQETTPAVVAPKEETQTEPSAPTTTYIANKNTKKFHYPYCHSVDQMKEKNKRYLTCTRSEAISQGYSPCGNCNP